MVLLITFSNEIRTKKKKIDEKRNNGKLLRFQLLTNILDTSNALIINTKINNSQNGKSRLNLVFVSVRFML